MANTTFQIQYIHTALGVQIAFRKAETAQAAQEAFEDAHPDFKVLDCRCVEGQPSGYKKS